VPVAAGELLRCGFVALTSGVRMDVQAPASPAAMAYKGKEKFQTFYNLDEDDDDMATRYAAGPSPASPPEV